MPWRNVRLRNAALAAAGVAALAVLATVAIRPSAERGNEAPQPPAYGSESVAPGAEPESLRYDVEYPAIGYSTAAPADRVADLTARIAAGEARLEHDGERGYLDSLLRELDIDPSSQVLVFSTTSLQVGSIRPETPRALYFNDDTYVAWVQSGGPIEIASMDPNLGPVFYTLEQTADADPERHTVRCLRCHDSLSLTGGGVPRFIIGSGYIGTRGNIVSHEGWILTSPRTPIRHRWGGWYVTGRHGDQVHLGNIVVRNIADLQDLERLRIGNLDTLEPLVDTTPYIADSSDIVALLVMQHQVDVQNEIARVMYAVNGGGDIGGNAGGGDSSGNIGGGTAGGNIAAIVEPLVEAMLSVGEAELTDPIEGNTGFAERFEQRGPFDAEGRSLRELDLRTRLLRYPLSYVVHTRAFAALPDAAKTQAYRRFRDVLTGEDRDERFAHLSDEDRAAALEILLDTDPAFAAIVGDPGSSGGSR